MINIKQFFRFIIADPVNLSIKGKLLAVVACFTSILITAWLTEKLNFGTANPIIIASMGASAVILFFIPHSPLAQPWPLIGGQLTSAITGVWCVQTFTDTTFASAFAVGGSVLVMLLFRCLHPPGAATALIPILASGSTVFHSYGFVLMPVGLNMFIMLIMALTINRWVLHHQYPLLPQAAYPKKHTNNARGQPPQIAGISEADLQKALENMEMYVDVSTGDLSRLIADAQLLSFKRNTGNITCADIMVKNILTVEYGTEVEEAWKIMQKEKLKALPVVDRGRRVIGIVTWNDFFKFINWDANETFTSKLQAFIRRTPDVSTNKPEFVGHIMTSPVKLLPENTNIADLIPLMSYQRYRQIPIVNIENRLVGMVFQTNLIEALFNQGTADKNEQQVLS